MQKALGLETLTDTLQLPLSQEAYIQLQNVQQSLNAVTLADENDSWLYSWTSSSSSTSTTRVYRSLIGHQDTHIVFKWLWKNNCQPKHKVFGWLLLRDRLSTRNILRRKNMQLDSYYCALCNCLTEETVDHLFADCAFARMCWNTINVEIPLGEGFPELAEQVKAQIHSPFFMETIILLCWAIWMIRNDLIFSGVQPDLQSCRRRFTKEFGFLLHRVKQTQADQLSSWLQTLSNPGA